MNTKEKKEYDDGHKDGYEERERKTNNLESWYSAGYTNGQSDRIMRG